MLELYHHKGLQRIFFLNGEDCLEVDLGENQTVQNSPAEFVRRYEDIEKVELEDFLKERCISLDELLLSIQHALEYKRYV